MRIESATWYGSIDARLRGHAYDFEGDEVVLVCDSDDDDGSETDGATTVLELKRKSRGLSQAIGAAILASFTERKLHPQLDPLYPCILLNCTAVKFIFYDCKNDYLVITDRINYIYIFNTSPM